MGNCVQGSRHVTALESHLDSSQFVSLGTRKGQEKPGSARGQLAGSSLWDTNSRLVHPKPGNPGRVGLGSKHSFYLKGPRAQQHHSVSLQGARHLLWMQILSTQLQMGFRPRWPCRRWGWVENWHRSLRKCSLIYSPRPTPECCILPCPRPMSAVRTGQPAALQRLTALWG